jgi:UDP-N-acetylglucosamine 2-epimerase (non-hydrolysing)
LVAHLEAGLRSFDRSMPEEINRLATDALADVLWTPSPDGDENLIREGVAATKIVRVGNIMIDSLEMMRGTIEAQQARADFGLAKGGYGGVTFHRPANVDNPDVLAALCDALVGISTRLPLVFPVHPRTRKNLQDFGLLDRLRKTETIILSEPLNYVRFMSLVFDCRLVLTDSGGIQEETTYLGIPCLTMRPNTERPVTITQGTNRLCTVDDIREQAEQLLSQEATGRSVPEMWDGNTAGRVVASIKEIARRNFEL